MGDRFIHRFRTPARANLPAVFVENATGPLGELVTADELNCVTDLGSPSGN